MFLSTSLSLGCTQLIKDINSPAERIIVSLVAVQLVKSLKFRVGDDKIFEKVRVASQIKHSYLHTLEVALDTRGSDTLGQHGKAPLNSPRDQQLSGVLVQLLGDFFHRRVVDNAVDQSV